MHNRIIMKFIIIILLATSFVGCSVKNNKDVQNQMGNIKTEQEGSNYKATIKTGIGLKNAIGVQEKTERTGQIKAFAKKRDIIDLSGNGLVDFGAIPEDVLQVVPYSYNVLDVVDFGLLVNLNGILFKINFVEEKKGSANDSFLKLSNFKITKLGEECKKVFSCPQSNYYGFLQNNGTVIFYGAPPESAMMPQISGMRTIFKECSSIYEEEIILEKISEFWAFDSCFAYIKNNSLYLMADEEILIEKDCGVINDLYASVNGDNYDKITLMYTKDTGVLCMYEGDNSLRNIDVGFLVEKIYFNDKQLWAMGTDNNLYLWGSICKKEDERTANIACEEAVLVASNIIDFKANYYKRETEKVPDIYAQTENGELLLVNSDVSVERKKKINQVTIYTPVVYAQVKRLFPGCWITQDNLLILDSEGYKNIAVPKDNPLVYLRWFTCAESMKNNQSNVVSNDVMIDKNVISISGDKYIKDNQLYRYTKKGIKKERMGASASAKSLYCFDVAYNFNYIFTDVSNNVWLRRKKPIYSDELEAFMYNYYGKNKFAVNEAQIVENSVDELWVDEYGIAFVRGGDLYAHGTLEMYRDICKNIDYEHDIYEDYMPLPNKLVKYSGINATDIANVSFSETKMFVTMKNGDVYRIFPRQDGSKSINKRRYVSSRVVSARDKMQEENVLLYTNKYKIYKTGEAILQFENSVRKVKNVEKVAYGYNNDVCFVLDKNGNLYGWGYNGASMICKKKVEFIPFEQRVLVARGVDDFSVYNDKLFYLNENGELYFRGFKGERWERNPYELVNWVEAETRFGKFM